MSFQCAEQDHRQHQRSGAAGQVVWDLVADGFRQGSAKAVGDVAQAGRVASSVQLSVEDAGGERGSVDADEYVMQLLERIEVDA